MTTNKIALIIIVMTIILAAIYNHPIREKDLIGEWEYGAYYFLTFAKNGEVTFKGSWASARELYIRYGGNEECPDSVVAKGRYTIDSYGSQPSVPVIIIWEYVSVNSEEFRPVKKDEEGRSHSSFWNEGLLFFRRSIFGNSLFIDDGIYYTKMTSKTP